MKIVKPHKLFESTMVWLLSICLLMKILLIFKLFDISYKIKGKITNQTDFVTLVSRLSEKTEDLKSLEILGTIYRTFLLLLIIVFFIFVLYRLTTKQYSKLLQSSTIMVWIATMFSIYYVYITKDVFYALKSITTRIYMNDLPSVIYLMAKIQYILDIQSIIKIITVIILVTTSFSIILNVRALFDRNDEAKWKKLNGSILSFAIIVLSSLITLNIYTIYERKQFKPLDYMVINYTHDEKGIYLVGGINMRKVNEENIDPALRHFYLTGINYEIENSDKILTKNDKRKVKVSYDIETKEMLGLKTPKLLQTNIKNSNIPKVVDNIDEISLNSLYDYLYKYDARVEKNSIKDDNLVGIYENILENGNKEYYYLEKVKYNQLSISVSEKFNEDDTPYKFIYLGHIYRDGRKVVGLSALNLMIAMRHFNNVDEMKKILSESKILKVK